MPGGLGELVDTLSLALRNTGLGRQYDVTRDGRFLINTVLDEVAAPITLIEHWNPEAKP